jgi:hypothetical protein
MKINLFCCGSKKHLDAAEIDEISSEATVPPTNEKKAADKTHAVTAEPISKDITWIWYGETPPDHLLRNMVGIAASHPDYKCRWITDSPATAYKALAGIEGLSLDKKLNNIEIVPKKALYEEPTGMLTRQDLKDLEIASSLEGIGPLGNRAAESDIDRLLAVYRYGTRYFDADEMLKGRGGHEDWGNRIDKSKLPEEYRNLVLDRKKLPDTLVARHGVLVDLHEGSVTAGGITCKAEHFTNSIVAAPPQSEIVGRVLKKIARNYKSMSKEDLEKLMTDLVKSLTKYSVPKRTASTLEAMQALAGGKLLGDGFQSKLTSLLKRQAFDAGFPVDNTRRDLSMALTGPTLLSAMLNEEIEASGKDPEKSDRKELAFDYDLQYHFSPDTSAPWSSKIENKPSAEAEDIQPGKNRPSLPYLNPKTRSAGTALQQKFFKDETDAGNKAL